MRESNPRPFSGSRGTWEDIKVSESTTNDLVTRGYVSILLAARAAARVADFGSKRVVSVSQLFALALLVEAVLSLTLDTGSEILRVVAPHSSDSPSLQVSSLPQPVDVLDRAPKGLGNVLCC